MTDIETKIARLTQEARNIEAKIAELEARKQLQDSFGQSTTVYLLERRSIDTGRFEKAEGVFSSREDAIAFGENLDGYGVGGDLTITPVDFYSERV